MQPEKLDAATKERVLALVADMRSLGILRITKDFILSEDAGIEVWMATAEGDRERYTEQDNELCADRPNILDIPRNA